MMQQLRLAILLFFALLLLPLNSSCGSASPGNTTLSVIQGEVLIKKAASADWVQAEVNMVLKVNDAIKSGPIANALITFFDGSTLELKPNTQIEIKDLVNGQTTSIRLKQEIGETTSKVKKLIDPASRYEIETPVAVAGVKGSQMVVIVAPDGATEVQNLEGQISVAAQGVELIIPVGKSSTVQPGQTPADSVNISYSAVQDFRLSEENPNGVWSYGWMPTDFSGFNLYTTHDYSVFNNYTTRNLFVWYAGIGRDRTPCVWLNSGDLAYGVPPGWLSLHPGPGQEASVLRWTAPAAGDIQVTGEFLAGDIRSMTVAVRHNNRELWSALNSGSFDLKVKVNRGDKLDFLVYAGYNYGNTPISASIRYQD